MPQVDLNDLSRLIELLARRVHELSESVAGPEPVGLPEPALQALMERQDALAADVAILDRLCDVYDAGRQDGDGLIPSADLVARAAP